MPETLKPTHHVEVDQLMAPPEFVDVTHRTAENIAPNGPEADRSQRDFTPMVDAIDGVAEDLTRPVAPSEPVEENRKRKLTPRQLLVAGVATAALAGGAAKYGPGIDVTKIGTSPAQQEMRDHSIDQRAQDHLRSAPRASDEQ